MNRKIDDLLTNAGFQIEDLKTTYLPGPGPMTYTYQGLAHTQRGFYIGRQTSRPSVRARAAMAFTTPHGFVSLILPASRLGMKP